MKFGVFYEHQLPRPWEDGAVVYVPVDERPPLASLAAAVA